MTSNFYPIAALRTALKLGKSPEQLLQKKKHPRFWKPWMLNINQI